MNTVDSDVLRVMLIGAEDALAARVVAGLSAHASVAVAADTASADWSGVELAIFVTRDGEDDVLRSTTDRPVLFVQSGRAKREALPSLVGSWDPAEADTELVAVLVELAERRAERAIDAATLAKLEDALGAAEVAELLETYLQTSPALLTTATEALRDRDARLLFSQAHQLKASSAAVGLPDVARAAAALEAAAQPEISDLAPGLLCELERQFRWALRALLRRGG